MNETLLVQERYRFDRKGLSGVVKELSEVSGWRSTVAILSQWAVIIGSAILAIQSGQWFMYLLAWMLIASRQHALSVLIHDAAHFRLYKNSRLNDFMSDVFCAFPIGASTSLYRTFHLNHHRFTNTEKDPEVQLFHSQSDWTFPKSKKQIAVIFAKDIFGLNSMKTFQITKIILPAMKLTTPREQGGLSVFERVIYIGFSVVLLTTLTLAHFWMSYFLFWIVPTGMTAILFRLRMIAEHHGVPNDKEINGTRTVLAGWLESTFLSPFNVNFHLEHHMFPSVPFFNLKKLHKRLLLEPDFAAKAHFTSSYLGRSNSVLDELTRSPVGTV